MQLACWVARSSLALLMDVEVSKILKTAAGVRNTCLVYLLLVTSVGVLGVHDLPDVLAPGHGTFPEACAWLFSSTQCGRL